MLLSCKAEQHTKTYMSGTIFLQLAIDTTRSTTRYKDLTDKNLYSVKKST